jgi:very-short-patch-repair endonuclease
MKMIIECDGNYWHGNKDIFPTLNKWQIEQIEEDRIRTKELKERGYKVIRLWEKEIKEISIKEFINHINNVNGSGAFITEYIG